MRLRKRIEKLELLQKQRDCVHQHCSKPEIKIKEYLGGTAFDIDSTCPLCGKEFSRCTTDPKIEEAYKVMRDLLFGTPK